MYNTHWFLRAVHAKYSKRQNTYYTNRNISMLCKGRGTSNKERKIKKNPGPTTQ